jgi:hypothetical protein
MLVVVAVCGIAVNRLMINEHDVLLVSRYWYCSNAMLHLRVYE